MLNRGPDIPLMSTQVNAEERRMEIYSFHRLPKAKCKSVSRRKAHETESKARAMSCLSRTLGSFRLCKVAQFVARGGNCHGYSSPR